MGTEARIFVAGHPGMAGFALIRHLRDVVYNNVITRSRAELDLTRQADVETFFADNAMDQVYLAAAKVEVSTPTTPTRPTSSKTT